MEVVAVVITIRACLTKLDPERRPYMSSMKPSFVRRKNDNGTIDSVCRNCFITVATATRELDLDKSEGDHICDPHLVKYWKEMGEGKPTRTSTRGNTRRMLFIVES
jgi:hypothetical protein